MRATKRALALVVILALPACSLFRQQNPTDECSSNDDCFQGVGEKCLKVFDGAPGPGTCGLPSDAGPDATPPPDAPPGPPDATPPPDGAPVDAGAVDA